MMNTVFKKTNSFSTRDLTLIGMFAACMAIISQLSIPMPTGVPLTLQMFGVALTGAVLGWRSGFLALLVYILIGACGAPVFSNFRGGAAILSGVTGGYLCAYPVMAMLCGVSVKTSSKNLNRILFLLLPLLGLAFAETYGGLQWALLSGEKSFPAIMAYSLVAFIPKDTILTIAAIFIGKQLKQRLSFFN